MRIVLAVLNDFKVFFNVKTRLGRKRSLIALATLFVIFIGYKMISGGAPEAEKVAAPVTEVAVLSVDELGANASFDTIGKVEAVSEANLQTEAGGRITAV